MGFDITDLSDENEDISINYWNWRPTVELIRAAHLLDVERLEGLHQGFSSTRISRDEARALEYFADFCASCGGFEFN